MFTNYFQQYLDYCLIACLRTVTQPDWCIKIPMTLFAPSSPHINAITMLAFFLLLEHPKINPIEVFIYGVLYVKLFLNFFWNQFLFIHWVLFGSWGGAERFGAMPSDAHRSFLVVPLWTTCDTRHQTWVSRVWGKHESCHTLFSDLSAPIIIC